MPRARPKKKDLKRTASRPVPLQASLDCAEQTFPVKQAQPFPQILDRVRRAANRGDSRAMQAIRMCEELPEALRGIG